MTRRLIALVAATTAAGLLAAMPALGAVAGEVTAGRSVAQRLQSGQASCQNLSASEFEHLGEYVMDRMAGSRAEHEAMNRRMDTVMGAANADRLHEALGRRYAGCRAAGSGGGMMGGGGMIGGGPTGAGWAGMASSRYAWMRDGAWRHLSRAGWDHAGADMMGRGWMTGTGGGWSAAAIAAVLVGALVLGGLVVLTIVRLSPRHRPGPTAA